MHKVLDWFQNLVQRSIVLLLMFYKVLYIGNSLEFWRKSCLVKCIHHLPSQSKSSKNSVFQILAKVFIYGLLVICLILSLM